MPKFFIWSFESSQRHWVNLFLKVDVVYKVSAHGIYNVVDSLRCIVPGNLVHHFENFVQISLYLVVELQSDTEDDNILQSWKPMFNLLTKIFLHCYAAFELLNGLFGVFFHIVFCLVELVFNLNVWVVVAIFISIWNSSIVVTVIWPFVLVLVSIKIWHLISLL